MNVINELKVGDGVKIFSDCTVFIGNETYFDLQIFYPNETTASWNYNVIYCTSDYILLKLETAHPHGRPEIHILNTYESIKIENECNK